MGLKFKHCLPYLSNVVLEDMRDECEDAYWAYSEYGYELRREHIAFEDDSDGWYAKAMRNTKRDIGRTAKLIQVIHDELAQRELDDHGGTADW